MPIDYDGARNLLREVFAQAEADLLQQIIPRLPERIAEACDLLFRSQTQAYREVLLGCTIARIQDSNISIRQPYLELGPHAFSGRSLDENVINPFLHDRRIPSSRGPYLSVFRRSVVLDESIRKGLRDKEGYDAFLNLVTYLESTLEESELHQMLRYLLFKFAELREAHGVPLSRLQRMSLEQYDILVSGLLASPSGGRLPVLLVVAMFTTIRDCFNLDWNIAWQGINVADRASKAGGDITITKAGQVVMAVEVTERPVDRNRVVATFQTKIAPIGIEDYLFFVRADAPAPDARQQAHQYFAQGHEVNFLEIKNWILMSLATVGKGGRTIFNAELVKLLESADTPKAIKVIWNDQIARITGEVQ